MIINHNGIEERINQLSNSEIINAIKSGKESYQPGIFEIYLSIAKDRGIDFNNIEVEDLTLKAMVNTQGKFEGGGRPSLNFTNFKDNESSKDQHHEDLNYHFRTRLNFQLLFSSILISIVVMLIFIIRESYIGLAFTALIEMITIYFSLPMSYYLNPNELLQKRLFMQEEKIFTWKEIQTVQEKNIDAWKNPIGAFVMIFFFGWFSRLLFRNNYRYIQIEDTDFSVHRFYSFRIRNYRNLIKSIYYRLKENNFNFEEIEDTT
jgi:hypothetical protein